MIKAVIFDYDGVLVDSFPVFRNVYAVIGKELNIPEWTRIGDKVDSFSVDWHETCRRFNLTTTEDRERVEEVYLREYPKVAGRIELFPGIQELLESTAGCKRAILSNNVRSTIQGVLKRLNIDHFDSIVGGEDGKQKPDPELFLISMKRLGVTPEETVYVCDMREEIEGARAAGIKTVIAVTYGYHSKEHLAGAKPDYLVDSPQEILEVITSL